MGLLRPHPSPYTTLAAGYYPTLAVLANIGDFQGIIQGADSKAYAGLQLYALGEFLLQQGDSSCNGRVPGHSLQGKGIYLCYSSLLHQQ